MEILTFEIADQDGCQLEGNVRGGVPRQGDRVWLPGGHWAVVIRVEWHVNRSLVGKPTRCLPVVFVQLEDGS